ncbi:U6 snRNA (guanine-N(2))-methyltransferase THUMPD2 [Genypterus blacodes]|uniref:U6 snRNA (guanine-N(2))-methyltransferase THUMPD2 n=1 Tax=Genypterus blacodes TaxID=154954 RepID=UPI003F764A78
MAERQSERRLVRYFCTAGKGMEPFLVEEVKKKLEAEEVCELQGKVLFSSSAGLPAVRRLKAAERLFLLLRRDSAVTLPAHSSSAKAAAVLQARLLGDRSQWTEAAVTWSRLQGELSSNRTAHDVTCADLGLPRKRNREEEEECDGEAKESQREECGPDREEEEGERLRDKRRKRESGRDEPQAWEQRKDHEEEEELLSCDCATHEQEDEDDEPPPPPPPPVSPSFRINCKCTGALSRRFSTQELCQMIGGGVSRLLGWKVDLKNPQMEVSVSLTDDLCLMGIPLTRLPLANRSYIRTTGLRSTVSWAMTSLAQIQPGFCVLDPMCGVGTILLEAAQEHREACFLGVDNDDGQLQRANENIAFAEEEHRISLLKASSLDLPLPSSCVDAVISDLPFGRKYGTKANMADNLPIILTEMERVLRVGGVLVLLLSPQLSFLLKKLQTPQGSVPAQDREPHAESGHTPPPPFCSLQHRATHRVSLGAIDGLIHKYVKGDEVKL